MNSRSETDVLAGMMGADSRRIDGLVETVGEVRGDVSHLRSDVGRVATGVDELKAAMVGVARHTVLLEATREDMEEVRKHQQATDGRLSKIEVEMPGLIETRSAVMRAIWAVVALVGLAIVGLVIKIQAVT